MALFGLSGEEVKNLNDAIAKVKARLDELVWTHTRIEPNGPEKFTITIPAFPKEGGLVLDEFMGTVRATLGEERFAYYQSIARAETEMGPALGGGFGLTQTVINLQDLNGENGMQSGVSGFDEQTGWTLTVNAGLKAFKNQFPVAYRKLMDSGAIPRGSRP